MTEKQPLGAKVRASFGIPSVEDMEKMFTDGMAPTNDKLDQIIAELKGLRADLAARPPAP